MFSETIAAEAGSWKMSRLKQLSASSFKLSSSESEESLSVAREASDDVSSASPFITFIFCVSPAPPALMQQLLWAHMAQKHKKPASLGGLERHKTNGKTNKTCIRRTKHEHLNIRDGKLTYILQPMDANYCTVHNASANH